MGIGVKVWFAIALTIMIIMSAIGIGYFIYMVKKEVKGINLSFLEYLLYWIIAMICIAMLICILLEHKHVIECECYASPDKFAPRLESKGF